VKTYGIHHLGLSVRDLKRSIPFYRDLLGFEVIMEHEGEMAMIGDGTNRLTLWQIEDPAGSASFNRHRNVGLHHLAFRVDREEVLHEAAASLRQAGVTIEFGPGPARTGTHMLFPDPDGIRLELFYEPGKKG